MEMEYMPWDTPEVDVIGRLIDIFKKWKKWQFIGPHLRLVNKHWKSAVDQNTFHLSMQKLPDFPLCQQLPEILRRNRFTSVEIYPLDGDICQISRLGDISAFQSLQELKLTRVENGDAVIDGILPLRHVLRRISLSDVHISPKGLKTLSQLVKLRYMCLSSLSIINWHSDAEFQFLHKFEELETLRLNDCVISVHLGNGLADKLFPGHKNPLYRLGRFIYMSGIKSCGDYVEEKTVDCLFSVQHLNGVHLRMIHLSRSRLLAGVDYSEMDGLGLVFRRSSENQFAVAIIPTGPGFDQSLPALSCEAEPPVDLALITSTISSFELYKRNILWDSWMRMTTFRNLPELRMHNLEPGNFFGHFDLKNCSFHS